MKTALVAAVAVSGLGASCFSITDPFVVAVNVKDIRSVYAVTPGITNFDPGCITKQTSDYLDDNFNVQAGGGQLVDVTVQTNGAYAGSIVGGQVRIGASQGALTTLVTYAGPWSTFNTAQSLIQNSTAMTLDPGGVNTLINLIESQQPIVICHAGAFSQATVSGMSIDVSAFAQVNASP
jgi:hypothetical protein